MGVSCSVQESHFPHILSLLSSCKLETLKLTKTECFETDADMCYVTATHHNFIFNVIYYLPAEEKSLLIFWNSIWSYFSKIMVSRTELSQCVLLVIKNYLKSLIFINYFFSYKSFLSNWNSVRDYINCTSSCCCFFSSTVNLLDKCTKWVPCQRYVMNYKVLYWKFHFIFMFLFFLPMDLTPRITLFHPDNKSAGVHNQLNTLVSCIFNSVVFTSLFL